MGKEAAPANETKADKFKRLAISRTNKALDAIALIGGLASRTNYDYEPEQVEKIGTALLAELDKLSTKFKAALDGKAVAENDGFSL